MKCQIKYSVLFMRKINNKFYVFLNIAIKYLRVGNILQRMCLFLGSACFTKPPSPASVPSIENGMPLKQRKVSVSPSYDVKISHMTSIQKAEALL